MDKGVDGRRISFVGMMMGCNEGGIA